MPRVIVVVGSLNVDLVAYARRVPGPGETIIGDRFAQGFGGKGANQAVMAARLGGPVAMVGALGDDGYAGETEANLDRQGVDRRFVSRVAGSSGVAPIWVEADGTNRIIVIPGANALVDPERAAAAIRGLRPSVVIGQLEIPQAVTAAAFAAAGAGAVRVLNPAPAAPLRSDLLAETDWLIPNEVELAALASPATVDVARDDALADCATRFGVRLLVTLGERGAALVADGSVTRLPAIRVSAVDTTGAGDAFVGAFGYGLANGLEPPAAARLAIACASDSVTRPGTQASFASPERARAILAAIAGGAAAPIG